MSGRYEKKKEKRPLGWKKIMLIIIVVLLVLIIAVAIAGVAYYKSILDKINYVEVKKPVYTQATTEPTEAATETVAESTAESTEETTAATTEPHVASSADYINFLIVGQAARAGETERFADTMILATVNTYEKTLTLTSMLRDTLLEKGATYSGNGKTVGRIKLTTVYHLGYQWAGNNVAGSMELMNQVLYNNFGIEVDYNFEIDFEAFVNVINLLGGVNIELTQAEADYLNAFTDRYYYEMTEGKNWMDGSTALAYARMRKAEGDGESDIKRTARQRNLIEALVKQLKKTSVSDLQAMVNEVLPCITTSMTSSEITDTLLTMLPLLTDLEIKTGGTCPANYWGEMYDIYGDGNKHSVLHFDVQQTTATMRAITEGEGVVEEAE